jgi:gliding motility-associated-like protein
MSGDKSQNSYGAEDFWLVQIDDKGDVSWDLTLGGDSTDIMKNISLGFGSILVGGYSISGISGSKSQNIFGGYDYWLNKVNTEGDLINDKTIGGPKNDFLEEIRLKAHSPGYWISGTTYSSNGGSKISSYFNNGDVWILKLDTSLAVELDKTIGSSYFEKCKDMEISPEGSAIIAGNSNGKGGNKTSETKGKQDYWIYKIDTLGAIYWDRSYGGSQGDSLEAIFIKCDRGLLVGGYSASYKSGDRTYENKGSNDYWAFELSIPTRPWFNAQNVCSRTPLTLYDQSDVWPDSWLWNFDDPLSSNNTSETQHAVHTYNKPGKYNVSLSIKEGCQKDTSITQTITVHNNRVLGNIDLGRGRSVCGNSIEIQNVHNDAPDRVEYLWSTGETTESIFVESKGTYNLTITDANCSANNFVLVDTCPEFGIPKAFSPNGDEVNDIFQVIGVGLHEFELLIFNRWGQVIYKTNSQNEGWDGTMSGSPCQTDVYIYKITYRGLGLAQKQKVGQVALIR